MRGRRETEARVEAFRAQVLERVARLNVEWIQLEATADPARAVAILRELHTVKGEGSLFGFAALADVAHVIEDRIVGAGGDFAGLGDWVLEGFDLLDKLATLRPGQASAEAERFVATAESITRVVPLVEPGPAPTAPSRPAPPAERPEPGPAGDDRARPADAALRVTAEHLDRMRTVVGDLLLSRTRLTSQAADLRRLREAATARLETRALGEELGTVESALRDDVQRVANLVDALEDVVRAMRMVPVSSIFARYPRVVRDLARQLGRQARLDAEGEAALADRDVLEGLHEPLLHLIRNAIDHGLEPPEARTRAGKDPIGTLRLVASVRGDQLVLELGDDGAGVDLAAVRRRAVERGQLSPDGAETATPAELLDLLFLPGMTTRDEVTQVSGRGVGLDVVRQALVTLGGSVVMTSERGRGARFVLTAPISASITSVLLFQVGRQHYGLPASSVIAILDHHAAAIESTLSGPALRHDGRLIPVIALDAVVGEHRSGEATRVLIIQTSAGRVALAGTADHEQRDAVLKTGAYLGGDRLVAAGVALEDGGLAMILQPEALRRDRDASRARDHAAGPAPRVKVALVVEDSVVVRDLVAEALRSYGVHVLEAGDGVEALAELDQADHVDVIVTDIDMPRMDGLTLLRELRGRGGPRIPAVVVSSRGRDDDKAQALAVGADAYLVKSQFSRDGLWRLVERFLG